jgi:hypothetical protein
MGGIGVTQGVNGGGFVHTAIFQGIFEGFLDTAIRHRLGYGRERKAVPRRSREKPLRMAVKEPIRAQHAQDACGDWDIAILGPLAVAYVEHAAITIDVANL